ncbi:MAG: hypothetical protein DMG11_15240 [Acidobacteria bacterium]|nr:MAG: hypothetical protein DMG11_15240 [Acidobacteriota bacterium]
MLKSGSIFCVGIAVWAMNTLAFAQAPAKDKIPELASSTFAWLAAGADWMDPPKGIRGPIRNDPDHPYHGNLAGPGQVTLRIGNYKDPAARGRFLSRPRHGAIRAASPDNCSIRRSLSISSRRRNRYG